MSPDRESPVTSSPAAAQAAARWRPAKPEAPVIRTRGAQRGPLATRCAAEPWPLEATAASLTGSRSAAGGFRRRSSSPSTSPNSEVAPGRLRERAAVAEQRRLDERDRRPRHDVLEQPGERPAQRRGNRQAAVRGWRTARRTARRSARAAARRRRAAPSRRGPPGGRACRRRRSPSRTALVERLLREPHGRGDAPGERAAQGACAVEGHLSATVTSGARPGTALQ